MLNHLFESNRQWASKIIEEDAEFFRMQSLGQTPEYLWIGCSDSRVASNQLLGLSPGDLFVHRNIANVVGPGDLSGLAVLQFAVGVLGVKHIIVCGHYGCGGVRAATEGGTTGPIDEWLAPLRKLTEEFSDELARHSDEKHRLDLLCELNVLRQLQNVSESSPVREAWSHEHELHVHGWIYDISCGRILDLESTVSQASEGVRQVEEAMAACIARTRHGR